MSERAFLESKEGVVKEKEGVVFTEKNLWGKGLQLPAVGTGETRRAGIHHYLREKNHRPDTDWGDFSSLEREKTSGKAKRKEQLEIIHSQGLCMKKSGRRKRRKNRVGLK